MVDYSPSHHESATETSQRFVYGGLLDFDCSLQSPERQRNQFRINLVYPSQEFKQQQSTAVDSLNCVREEAIEHFELLKLFALADAEYQQFLKMSYDRKV